MRKRLACAVRKSRATCASLGERSSAECTSLASSRKRWCSAGTQGHSAHEGAVGREKMGRRHRTQHSGQVRGSGGHARMAGAEEERSIGT